MKTTFNKESRRYVDQWALDGPALSTGAPTLQLSVGHYKERKCYVATLSYIELEQRPGYAVELWQSDWPLIRVDAIPAPRYSQKAFAEFRERVLQRVKDADFLSERLLTLVERIPNEELAA